GGPPGWVVAGRGSEVTTAGDAVALLEAVRSGGAGTPLAVAAAWAGSEGRTPLEGLALVTDPAAGEVAWLPGDVLADSGVQAALSALTALPEAGRPPPAGRPATGGIAPPSRARA